MGLISQNGVDYPAPSVKVQSDGTATDLTNDRVPTGQTIKSYLNSNLYRKINTTYVYNTADGYATFNIQTERIIGAVCVNWGSVVAFVTHTNDSSNPSAIYFYIVSSSGTLSKVTDTRMYARVFYI